MVLTGGAGHETPTKGLTGNLPLMMTCRLGEGSPSGDSSPGWFLWLERIQRTKEVSLGGEVSFASRVTTDRARVAVVRRRFSYRYAYELACCYF